MYFRKDEDESGEYLRADGARFALQQARRVRPADGWTVFGTLEECLAAWELQLKPQAAAHSSHFCDAVLRDDADVALP